jgi:hypothetical protein
MALAALYTGIGDPRKKPERAFHTFWAIKLALSLLILAFYNASAL